MSVDPLTPQKGPGDVRPEMAIGAKADLLESALAEPAQNVAYSRSPGLARRLLDLDVSVVLTSYQSGFLYLVGFGTNGQINVHQTALPRQMGGDQTRQGGSF